MRVGSLLLVCAAMFAPTLHSARATNAAAPLLAVPTAQVVAEEGLRKTPLFRRFGVAEGLPSSALHALVEDRDGFLWIATVDGLARYDSAGFRIFRHDEKNPASIAGNDITTIFVDRENRVWCAMESNGLDMLDAARKQFVHFRHDDNNAASLAAADVRIIGQDSDGTLLVGTAGDGLDRLVPGSQVFTHLRHDADDPDSLTSNRITAFLVDSAGQLWVGSDFGLDRRRVNATGAHSASADRFDHVDFSVVRSDAGRVNVRKLVNGDNGNILAATNRGLLRIDANLRADIFAAGSESTHKAVLGFDSDDQGELWLGTQHGLDRRDRHGAMEGYVASEYLPGTIATDLIAGVLRDHEGNMWIATDGGLSELPASWRNFALYRHDPADERSLSSGRVQGLAVDARDGIWAVNMEGAIDRIDPSSGRAEHFAPRLPAAGSKSLFSVMLDQGGSLWIGHGSGLRIYRLDSGSIEELPVDAKRTDALVAGGIVDLVQSASGTVWAASLGGGLHRIDPRDHRIRRYEAGVAGLRSVDINQIGSDSRGTFLVASSAGLDRYDPATETFSVMPGAPKRTVLAFATAPDATLWLLEDGALEQFQPGPDGLTRIGHYDSADNWLTATFTGMQIDADGLVWVAGPRGLWRYDWHARSLRQFAAQDGLPSAEFNDAPLVKRADGSIFGATLGGIVGFVPTKLVENVLPPKIVLDGASIRRNDADLDLDTSQERVALLWNDRDLRIRARALSYINPAANRYQWQLVGYDEDWVDTGNRGEREFSQLPAGDYRLRARATNGGGVWNELAAPMRIEQAAPPWATRWAYAGYAITLILIAWLAIRSYRKRLESQHAFTLAEQQRQFAEGTSAAKTNFLATMGHEIRTPMTGVLGMTELLLRTPLDAKQRGYVDAIASSGHMLLRLVNDSLDLARIEAGKLELEDAPLDLHALIAQIAALEQTLAQSKGLTFEHAIAADAPRRVRGDAVRIKQIFLNLVSNAIKFTERGKVEIELARAPNGGAQFSVRDTGPGIGEATRVNLFQRFEQAQGAQQRYGGSGLGLAICRELVARMGGEISVESALGAGTGFIVTLPLAEIDATENPSLPAGLGITTQPGAANAAAGLRILLVEDDVTVASVITGMLEAQNHRVCHVAQGLAALSETDISSFDVALLDLDLPGIDGLSLARMLRERETRENRARLPLIGLSARSVGDEEALCRAAGMDAFLRKPVAGAMLRACVKYVVERA